MVLADDNSLFYSVVRCTGLLWLVSDTGTLIPTVACLAHQYPDPYWASFRCWYPDPICGQFQTPVPWSLLWHVSHTGTLILIVASFRHRYPDPYCGQFQTSVPWSLLWPVADNGSRFVSQTCQLMYQISEWTLSSETTPPDRHDEGIGAHDEILPGMLGSVIEMLAALVQHKREHAVQVQIYATQICITRQQSAAVFLCIVRLKPCLCSATWQDHKFCNLLVIIIFYFI